MFLLLIQIEYVFNDSLKILTILLCAAVLMQTSFVLAFETDQYHLPNVPLADIGEEVNDYAEQNIRKVLEKTNQEILRHQACLDKKPSNCGSAAEEQAQLEKLRSPATVVKRIFNLLGGGVPPFTNAGTYMEKHHFTAQPARYKTSFAETIFKVYPINYLTISETVKIYGSEFGTDKVAHFFQQGFSYYKIYQRARAQDLSETAAVKKAIRWGRGTEETIYGTLVSGVFSNADLCANYTGMRFYQNLTGEVKINGQIYPPILVLKNGSWAFNENINLHENLLKPFLTGHFNEALNPSIYTNFLGFHSSVRHNVHETACPQWHQHFPNLTQNDFKNQTDALKLWNGEDYGFKDSHNFITIAETCFGS